MNAFSVAMDTIFADPNMATDAEWRDQGMGAPLSCRVIRKAPDDQTDYGGARLWSETTSFDVRVAEIAAPRAGDSLTVGAESFIVQGTPRRDRERLVWTIDTRPA